MEIRLINYDEYLKDCEEKHVIAERISSQEEIEETIESSFEDGEVYENDGELSIILDMQTFYFCVYQTEDEMWEARYLWMFCVEEDIQIIGYDDLIAAWTSNGCSEDGMRPRDVVEIGILFPIKESLCSLEEEVQIFYDDYWYKGEWGKSEEVRVRAYFDVRVENDVIKARFTHLDLLDE